jgi:hypothetical protein
VASLARLKAQIPLGALIGELPKLRRHSRSVEYIDSLLVREPWQLELAKDT